MRARFCGRCCSGRLLLSFEFVHALHQKENGKCHNDEADDGVDESAVAERDRPAFLAISRVA